MAQELQSLLFSDPTHGIANALPELREDDYQNEVLRFSGFSQKAYLSGLITKAEILGVPFPSSPSTISVRENHTASRPESNTTLDTTRARTTRRTMDAAMRAKFSREAVHGV
jgi:hypothetical protein